MSPEFTGDFFIMSRTICFIAVIIFSSCQKEIPINWPEQDPELVVNCLFTNEKPFEASISLTNSIPNATYNFIADATITIRTDQGLFDSLIHLDSGNYIGTKVPMAREKYYLSVTHPDYKSVAAKSSLPERISPELITVIDTAGIHLWGKPFSMITISFHDPADEMNYYEIGAYMIGEGLGDAPGKIGSHKMLWPYSVTDPVLTAEDIMEYTPSTFVFSDNLIDGTLYNLNAPIELVTKLESLELHLHFISASKEYYNFKKNLIKHLFNQGGRELDLMIINAGNPLPIYSNIENGHGIFAGLSIYKEILN